MKQSTVVGPAHPDRAPARMLLEVLPGGRVRLSTIVGSTLHKSIAAAEAHAMSRGRCVLVRA